jgi:hypothetical protein
MSSRRKGADGEGCAERPWREEKNHQKKLEV